MTVYKAPVEDTLFILNDVLNIHRYNNLPGFSDATPDMLSAILEEGAKFTEEVLHPLNAVGDHEGCVRNPDGSVTTPKGFKEAYKAYCEGGWMGLSMDPDYGGQGLPVVLNYAFVEYVTSANLAWGMYPGLAQGAYAALRVHASDELKAIYLPKIASGEWLGTMNLTEPHCGTDLGMLRTKAVPQGDGSYRISGQKIFISAGENDFADNIVHLVLARIEGAPAGVKGISLFVVPKFIPTVDNKPGEKNAVSCGKIEEKMGIHGNATCVMNYDGATGWLIGTENKGLNAMFVMMNEARLGGRHSGTRAVGNRLSERAGLCQGPLAGPLDLRHQGPGEAGRSADRPSRYPPQPHDHEGLQRSRPCLCADGRSQLRHRAPLAG